MVYEEVGDVGVDNVLNCLLEVNAVLQVEEELDDEMEPEDDMDEFSTDFGLESSHNIHFLIQSKHLMINEYLKALNPTFVILYDPDLFMVRSMEMFRCRRPGKPLRIYFLVYNNSVEEPMEQFGHDPYFEDLTYQEPFSRPPRPSKLNPADQ